MTNRCPDCGATLRVQGERLVCTCRGVMMTVADFTERVAELGSLDARISDGAELPMDCPRCDKPLRAAKVLGQDIARCDTHGLWFPNGTLDHALSRVGHRKATNPGPFG